MHVIWHDYVPHQPEPVPFSHLSQRPNKNVSRPGSSKERQPPVTAKGEKVQVPTAVVSLQSNGHGSLPKPPHATPACGAPSHSNAQVTYEGGILSSCDEVKRKERLPACVWATRPAFQQTNAQNPKGKKGLIIFFRPTAICTTSALSNSVCQIENQSILFHESLHEYYDLGDSTIQRIFGVQVREDCTANISDYISFTVFNRSVNSCQ